MERRVEERAFARYSRLTRWRRVPFIGPLPLPFRGTMGGGDGRMGGVRGGRDQFNWEDVKARDDRSYYLGASVKASVGRWQKNKDILWYTRDGSNGAAAAQQAAAAEVAAVRVEEERLMQEALGLRPVTQRRGAGGLDASELQQILKRGAGVDGTEEEDPAAEAMRVKGVGYTPAVAEQLKASGKQQKAGEAFDNAELLAGTVEGGAVEGMLRGDGDGVEHPHGGRRARHDSDDEDSDDSGARKRARKEAKRAKKEAKRERKEQRRSRSRSRERRRSRSRSRSRDRRDDMRRYQR